MYSKWDDKDISEVKTDKEHDLGAENALKPVDGVEIKAEGKSIVSGPAGTKDKKAAEVAKAGEQAVPYDLFPYPKPVEDKDSGLQDKAEKHLTAGSGDQILLH